VSRLTLEMSQCNKNAGYVMEKRKCQLGGIWEVDKKDIPEALKG